MGPDSEMPREEHSAVSRAVAGLLGVGLDAGMTRVAQISAFDTAEGRRLHAKAMAFDEVLGIAAEALALLESKAVSAWLREVHKEHVRALRERLEAACRLEFWWPAR